MKLGQKQGAEAALFSRIHVYLTEQGGFSPLKIIALDKLVLIKIILMFLIYFVLPIITIF